MIAAGVISAVVGVDQQGRNVVVTWRAAAKLPALVVIKNPRMRCFNDVYVVAHSLVWNSTFM